jgi:hypothetical protein
MRHVEDVSDEFALAMVHLADAYGAALSENRIRQYYQALGDLPAETLARAFGLARNECRFFPSIAELRSMVAGSTEDRALVAFSSLQLAATRIGAWSSLEMEDAAAAEALVLVFGSWPTYCELESPAVGMRRAEFVAAYRAASRRPRATREPVRLAGLCEAGGAVGTNHSARTWVGRVTSGGDVTTEVDRPALTGGEKRRALAE